MQKYQLAQLNIAAMKAPLDSPLMAEFNNSIDRINALADVADGFVWRFQTPEGDATAERPLGESTLVNLSVWRDLDSLKNYVYKSAHTEVMRKRHEWFDAMKETHMVLWWVPAGHLPSVDEALARLELLRSAGPNAQAFSFRQAFDAPQD